MANIQLNRTQLSPKLVPDDAINMIRELFRWNPLNEMASAYLPTFNPTFEVRETKDRFIFKADVPGVKEQALEITLSGNRLNIAGEREKELVDESETYFTAERVYGAFNRSFVLPEGIDVEHVQAGVKDGVLTIIVPKAEEMKPKKIALEASGKIRS